MILTIILPPVMAIVRRFLLCFLRSCSLFFLHFLLLSSPPAPTNLQLFPSFFSFSREVERIKKKNKTKENSPNSTKSLPLCPIQSDQQPKKNREKKFFIPLLWYNTGLSYIFNNNKVLLIFFPTFFFENETPETDDSKKIVVCSEVREKFSLSCSCEAL